MNNPFLAQCGNDPWMMEPVALTRFLETISAKTPGEYMSEVKIAYQLPIRVEGDTAVIPISGVLLKSVPGWVRFWGFDATGYDEIRSMVALALADERIKRIQLRITSPGGMVAGGMETGDAIRAADASKPVTAVIEDLGASGAFWLATSARRIEANANAEVGSIGVYTYYVDWSKADEQAGAKVIVIRSGEHKGMGLDHITGAQIAAMQEVIDGMNAHFIDQVAAGRKVPRETAAGWATGRVWLAPAAKDLGLIDAITSSHSVNPTSTDKESSMDQKEIEAMTAQASEKAVSDERKRAADLKAAFPTDAAFALEAIEQGWDVTQAKAERHDRREKEATRTPPGDKGVQYHDSDAGGGPDFMAQAKAVAKEQKIPMTEAMRQVQSEDPAAYEKFREKESHRAVRTSSGGKAAGRVSL